MLTLRHTNIAGAIALAALLWLHTRHGWSLYWVLPLLAGYSLVLFYGSYYIGSNFYIRVVCSGPPPSASAVKSIALTFDDGPAGSYTAEMLDILKEQAVPAAFFCIGQRIAGREDLLRRAHDEGHVIGNHSDSHHLWFDLFSTRRMTADLRTAAGRMERVLGLKPLLFRPPYGVTNPNLARAIRRCGYLPVGWNIRSLDTVIKDPDRLLEKLLRALRPGAVVLLHDTSAATLAVLPAFIREARARGYVFTRLDTLIGASAYVPLPESGANIDSYA